MTDESAPKWVSTARAAKLLGVCPRTVRIWADHRHVRKLRTPGGHLRFAFEDFDRSTTYATTTQQTSKKVIGYARVSTQGQKDQLKNQVDYIRANAKVDEIIAEVGSAVNFGKHGLQGLLEQVMRGVVSKVIIADSATSSSSGSATTMDARSLFWPTKESIHARQTEPRNLRTIYSPSRLSSLPGYTDGGPTRDARKRAISQARALQLDERQRSVYEKMATAYRWAYNEAVARYRTERVADPGEWSTRTAYSVRDRVLEKAKTCKWTERYPRKLLQQGVEEFTKAVKSSWALFKSKLSSARGRRCQPRRPIFKFRSRKDWTDRWRFTLPKAACTLVDGKLFLCKNTLGNQWGLKQGVVVKGQEELKQAFGKDGKPFSEIAVCKLLNGDIILRVTCYEQAEATERSKSGNENQVAGNESQERVAMSLDPGKRTFLTGYVNGVGCGDVDANLNARLGRLYERLKKVDAGLAGRIEGMAAPPVGQRRRRLLGRRRAVESRIAAIVDDAHWKLAHWLCSVADGLPLRARRRAVFRCCRTTAPSAACRCFNFALLNEPKNCIRRTFSLARAGSLQNLHSLR